MLTLAEKKEIEALLPNYPARKAAGIDALLIVQRYRGWISDETLDELARFLEMTPAELDAVATFYNLIFRRPVGRHVIFLCDSVSCWIMGYDSILDYLKKSLGVGFGETTADGRFTLLPH
ncbi:MAG: NADH-quinone oxidoreductase subunit NuoE, partial [Deltaproteobacteria bacterium]|nr:NADH-quinone oxidoreductase subunit NuoE [Deltaproteobacteria bacterium]